MLDALVQGGGLSTGVYTSPHLVRYNERIAIDGHPASDAEILRAFERIEDVRGNVPLTYFEFGTLAAWLVFAERKVDVAILEIGLGGRLDAVNAIEPDAGLITSIALDHQDWLGDTLEDIGREKAGIMRPGKPTVFSALERPASVDETAEATGATLLAADRDFRVTMRADDWDWQGVAHSLDSLERPGLSGDFQVANAGGVLTLLEAVGGFEHLLDRQHVDTALASLTVPGRMQSWRDSHRFLFDVAHNPAAATALAQTLGSERKHSRVAIVGMLNTKDTNGVIAPLADVIGEWIAVTASGVDAVPAAELARRTANVLNRDCLIAESVDAAIREARHRAGPQGEVIVLGSFHVVGPVQEALGL